MFLFASLAPFVVLANAVAANPIVVRDGLISLPFARYVNASGARDLVRRDQERARGFQESGSTLTSEMSPSIDVTNTGNYYVASVGVGIPATYYNLVVDTGSALTWVGAGKPYTKTNTSVEMTNAVSLVYGSASFSGTEYTDTVTIAAGYGISQQSIAVASESTGFHDVDGILGLGPINLTIGNLMPDIKKDIPTVTDNLFKNGAIASNLVSVSFEPTTAEPVKNGELTFGGVDPTKYTGDLTYVPLTTTSPSSRFWGVDQSIRYGDSVRILDKTAGIIDTGTSLILIATDAFDRYRAATGAVLDKHTHFLRINRTQYANLKSLFFTIGERTFELTANAQLWPRTLNGLIHGKSDHIYLVIGDFGVPSGSGLDFINGYTFSERFYSVFDTANRRVGLATTPFTMADNN